MLYYFQRRMKSLFVMFCWFVNVLLVLSRSVQKASEEVMAWVKREGATSSPGPSLFFKKVAGKYPWQHWTNTLADWPIHTNRLIGLNTSLKLWPTSRSLRAGSSWSTSARSVTACAKSSSKGARVETRKTLSRRIDLLCAARARDSKVSLLAARSGELCNTTGVPSSKFHSTSLFGVCRFAQNFQYYSCFTMWERESSIWWPNFESTLARPSWHPQPRSQGLFPPRTQDRDKALGTRLWHPKSVILDILWAEDIFLNDESVMICNKEWLFI